jgi:hypothetical protein
VSESPSYRPVDPAQVADEIADWLITIPATVRVAVDGADALDPAALCERVVEALHRRGRPAIHVRAELFWRDASLRLEYGHADVHSLRHDWLDAGALRRELLDPLGPDGSALILGSLRDPVTNRSTREQRRRAEPTTILLLSGQLLLGQGLPFDRVIRLDASPATLARITAPERAWTLAAIADYEAEVKPSRLADLELRVNDPRHPALRMR